MVNRQYWTSKEDMVNGYVIIIMDFLEPFITGFMSFWNLVLYDSSNYLQALKNWTMAIYTVKLTTTFLTSPTKNHQRKCSRNPCLTIYFTVLNFSGSITIKLKESANFLIQSRQIKLKFCCCMPTFTPNMILNSFYYLLK